jgi:hypothetical protein
MEYKDPSSKNDVIDMINKCRNLKKDWDSYNGDPPSSFVCDTMIDVVERTEENIPLPIAVPGNRCLQLEWYEPESAKELEISLHNGHKEMIYLQFIVYPDYIDSGEIKINDTDKIRDLLEWLIKK